MTPESKMAQQITDASEKSRVATGGDLPLDWQAFKKELVRDGWRSPMTYDSSNYGDPGDFPGVYLHAAVENYHFKRAMIGYVGMSTRLAQRLANHPIPDLIEAAGFYCQTWFKATQARDLRDVERHLIQVFDPPWNIMCRPRGRVAA